MKRTVTVLLTIIILAASLLVGKTAVLAESSVYVDGNGNTQYAKAAQVTYNNSVMSGMGLANVKDGNYATTYVSEDNPTLSEQYIQFAWEEAVEINMVTLYSEYCGASGRNGQAPTEWTVQTSTDGTTFTDICTVKSSWQANDNVQSKGVIFETKKGVLAVRIKINKANLSWKHYAVSEIEIAKAKDGYTLPEDTQSGDGDDELTGVYEDKDGNKQYAKAAEVTYNNSVMSGMGLANVKDGNYVTTYVSEDNPTLSNQYIQFKWAKGIEINMVTLYSQYCGTAGKDGQAPTEWTVQVSSDGTTFTDACKVASSWQANDNIQSKSVLFETKKGVVALRVLINKANLSWKHYAISEIEIAKSKEEYKPSGEETEQGEGDQEELAGVYEDKDGNKQYAKAAEVTYNNSVMSGMGLMNVKDGNYTSTYVSEDNPTLSNQYIQFKWAKGIEINMVTLYSQYCGTAGKDGQAPTEWTVQISKDGTTFTDACKATANWKSNDDVQSKSVMFDSQKDVVALRVVIDKANLSWKHYAVSEIEIAKAKEGYKPAEDTEGGEEKENAGVYEDKNGNTQYAKAAQVTYNDSVMSGMGLMNVKDGNYSSTYVSEDDPKMKNQYIQFTWENQIDINAVTLYSQYCGTKYKDGQAPVKWEIQVSRDGVSFSKVCDVKKSWRSNDNVQSKTAQFDLQKGIKAVRIVITDAKLDWKHYAISEIEIAKTKPGYVIEDLTGIQDNTVINGDSAKSPDTGDTASLVLPVLLMLLSLTGIFAIVLKRKSKD